MPHQEFVDAWFCGEGMQRLFHAGHPGVPLRGANRQMLMHLSNIGVSVMFGIELRAAQKTGQEFKLRLARMGNSMPATVHDQKRGAGGIIFDNIVKQVHQAANACLAADAPVG